MSVMRCWSRARRVLLNFSINDACRAWAAASTCCWYLIWSTSALVSTVVAPMRSILARGSDSHPDQGVCTERLYSSGALMAEAVDGSSVATGPSCQNGLNDA